MSKALIPVLSSGTGRTAVPMPRVESKMTVVSKYAQDATFFITVGRTASRIIGQPVTRRSAKVTTGSKSSFPISEHVTIYGENG